MYDMDYGLFNSGSNGVQATLHPKGAGDRRIFDALSAAART